MVLTIFFQTPILFFRQSLYSDCKITKDWTQPQSTTSASKMFESCLNIFHNPTSLTEIYFCFEDLTARLEQLIQPKTLSKEYVGDRYVKL